MSYLKQIVRNLTAVFVGITYLASIPLVEPQLAETLLQGDHAHVLEVVEHEGHADLVFHHTDDHDVNASEDHSVIENHSSDEHPHRCHVVQLQPESPYTAFVGSVQAPVVIASLVVCSAIPVLAGSRMDELPMLARPPPQRGSDVLICLRTTVLLV